MERKMTIALAMICAVGMILGTAAQTQAASARPAAQISYERAKEIALAEVGGGEIREIELDRERGVLVYDADIKYDGVKYEVYVDAATGEVVKFKQRGSSHNAVPAAAPTSSAQPRSQSNSSTGQISRERAKEIALAEVGGGKVREIELDRKKGRLAYEVEVKYDGWEYEVDIDAATGEIVKFETDD